MVLSEEQKRAYAKRLLLARMRLLLKHGFYGLLLMHMKFGLDDTCDTAATDGTQIFFSPEFMEKLNDAELEFILMHEILHIVLEHCIRRGERDGELFNIACDIVVNSIILKSNQMNLQSITLREYGESMHLAPDGKEGYEYTAEQVYEMLGKMQKRSGKASNGNGKATKSKKRIQESNTSDGTFRDDHSKWGSGAEDEAAQNIQRDIWRKRLTDACEAISIRDPDNQCGGIPIGAERLLKELRKPQTDLRTVLQVFVQEEITDYSFTPPDRRMNDSPFFLPDFNEKDDFVADILFMIDTSASMSDDMITAAYSEIKGAIDQFNGKLRGWLGFFDARVIAPKPFADEDEFRAIRPEGGGGTNFGIIFAYVRDHMQDQLPASIIILTDGYAPFPDESVAMGIPVLWLLNNDDVTPPWGKIARIKI